MKNTLSTCLPHLDTKDCTAYRERDFWLHARTFNFNPCLWEERVRRPTALSNPPNRPKRTKRARFCGRHCGAARRCKMEFSKPRTECVQHRAACRRTDRISSCIGRGNLHQRRFYGRRVLQPQNKDSSFVADLLSERDFAVRAGLHCAPLTHRYLKTENRGAVRVSIGVDNTDKEIYQFVATLERINAIKR